MESLKTFVGATAFAMCICTASMANAASFIPADQSFTTVNGALTLKSPSSMRAPVTCNIQFVGRVSHDGSTASLTSVYIAGSNALCAMYRVSNLPWVLNPTAGAFGALSNVSFTVAGLPPITPVTNCGPATISVSLFNNTDGLNLNAINQVLPGSCEVVSMRFAIPYLMINP
ncbi:protein activator of alkane oxidation PraB [Pseudomonas sp. TH32]|uniref:alkane oxidation protein activator PraB n=1 Tax=unclassified Pseudomonas TaxID=196821 RepID=UPI001914B43A|nr:MULTISPECIES: alkane oxidation protein activator PraB [unclassified Pseudomonas]MBK5437197.1 protein activator of alkane oxidation PraB [Pseudomonas sp. TH32]MDF3198757.1 alkane oxidation protein activator PraB [Pseudomonas sp. 1912-s]